MDQGSALKRLIGALVLAAMFLCSHAKAAERTEGDWYETQRNVSRRLLFGGADIAQWASSMSEQTPDDDHQAMLKLCILMRAGMNKQAVEALRELKALAPHSDVSGIYGEACDEVGAWEVAKAAAEIFADSVWDWDLQGRLLTHLQRTGWTVQQIDAWLGDKPPGRRNFWIKQRLQFNLSHGRGEAMVEELCRAVRENPSDIDAAIELLDVLAFAFRPGQDEWDLSWMAGTIRPQLATKADKIAVGLTRLNHWATAVPFYEQAIETPVTDKEHEELAHMHQAMLSRERLRASFSVRTRERLARCLLELDRHDQAQQRMVEAADIRKQHSLGSNPLLAGQVQATSGQRTIEGRIEQEETESKTDPSYWLKRARYYRGRNEPDKQEHALLQGLTLTAAQPGPEPSFKGRPVSRYQLVPEYAFFLRHHNRSAEAVALLRSEIEQTKATSASAQRAAGMLASHFDKHLMADDPILWRWLGDRPRWQYLEQGLLGRMLANVNRDDLDKHLARAEKLAFGSDPSRAAVLGWILNRMHFPQRSIALLEHAVDRAEDGVMRQRWSFTLLESYLDTGDWQQAERVFAHAADALTVWEQPKWYARIAVAAARAGAKTDALRIWNRVANLSPLHQGGLRELAAAGLRHDLVDYYQLMRTKMPESVAPDRALMVLNKQ